MHLDPLLKSLFGGIFLLLVLLLKRWWFLFRLTASDLINCQVVYVVDDATNSASSAAINLGQINLWLMLDFILLELPSLM